MLYLMLLDFLLSFPGSIHFICSSFLGFLSYLNAIGTVPCAVRENRPRGAKSPESLFQFLTQGQEFLQPGDNALLLREGREGE